MINTPGTNLNVVSGDSGMNNSFPQQNDVRRMTDNSIDSLDAAQPSISAISNEQLPSNGYYSQSQVSQQDNHQVASNGFTGAVPVSSQQYNVPYSTHNPHNQSGAVNHNGLVSGGHAFAHMQPLHAHALGSGDSYMHLQSGSTAPPPYITHPSTNSNSGNPTMVANSTAPSQISQHSSHLPQVPHTQNYNHMTGQMQMMGQHEPFTGSGQSSVQGPFVRPSHTGINPYLNQSIHGVSQQSSQVHNAHINIPLSSSVQNQAPMYPMGGQQPNVFYNHGSQSSQMPVNPPSAMHAQSNHQANTTGVSSAGLTSRAQQPKPWHNVEHQSERLSISENIVNLLKSRRPNAAENWTEKLPHMAKRLEDALYHEAENFEEYRDRSTLKSRLQKLAIQMGNSRPVTARNSGVPSQQHNQQPNSQQQSLGSNRLPSMQQPQVAGNLVQISSVGSSGVNVNGVNPSAMNINSHPNQFSQPGQYNPSNYMQQPNGYSGQTRLAPGVQSANPYPHMSHSQTMSAPGQNFHPGSGNMEYNRNLGIPTQPINGPGNQYPMNPADIGQNTSYVGGASMNVMPHAMMVSQQQNPPINGYQGIDSGVSGAMVMPTGANNQQQFMFTMGSNVPTQAGSSMLQVNPVQGLARKPLVANLSNGQQPIMAGVTSAVGINSNAPPSNSDDHRKQVLKQQQQRLLLLRHASKCPHENNRCPVTPHCWGMKQLWKHIMSCKDQDCKVPHCVSSRYVLSHYSKCKEPQCPVCGPVRDAIKKNYERSKEVVGIVTNPSVGRNSLQSQATNNAVNALPIEGKSNHPAPTLEEPVKKKRKTNDGQASKNTTLVIRAPAPVTAPKKVYPLDPISSAIYTFDVHQIESHIKSIQEGLRVKVSKIKEICKPLIDELYKLQYVQEIFGAPVDFVALSLPDYPEKVKSPMDLGTVMKKLESGSYRDFDQMASDVRLTFDNAMVYNPVGSEIHRIAKNAKKEFNDKFTKKIADFEQKISQDRQNKDACTICGEIKLEFAPPVLYCSGTCARAIKRGSWYYSNNAGTYYWCPPCFNSLKANEPVHLPDCTISKAELERNRKQHTEVHPEAWVECDGGCGRWVHQICSLFNSRRNVQDLPFVCPLCVRDKKIAEPNSNNIVMPVTKPMKACDLPRTVLSDFLEKRIQKRLDLAYEETAMSLNTSIDKVEKCPPLTLRQVSCVDKEQDVREGFLSRYKDKNYPTSFPCRVKCLVLFQNIDGQDVILFGMYVYEYGHNCPEPNRRRVYVSYLDSVHYLRPKQYRTLVYHEILISYLDYVKARGFHTAHIWACPPQKGDDYILHIHPVDQKTPRPQTLKVWYEQMLKRCVERGIVVEMQDLHTEFLTEANNDATLLPYFEGDYWVNEAEVIIKNLTEGKKGASLSLISDNAGQAKRKSKSKRAESKDVVGSSSSRIERDPLLAKLSSIIEPMKDTFFVARLHPREFAESFKNQAEQVSAQSCEDGDPSVDSENKLQSDALSKEDVGMPAIPDAVQTAIESEESVDEFDAKVASLGVDNRDTSEDILVDKESVKSVSDVDRVEGDKVMDVDGSEAIGADSSIEARPDISIPEAKEDDFKTETTVAKLESSSENPQDNNDINSPETLYRGANNNDSMHAAKRLIMCGEEMPVLPDSTEDVDEPQQNEHFETRQSFLNLCQGNHYQFDQLRRAKHSSMMVLYHLHNPDAPKFVPTCNFCKESILQHAFHCRSCEIDFCQSCVSQQGSRIHQHPLQQQGSAPQIVTEEQRKERERSIKLHMQLLNHAASCGGCESKNCTKMKEFLNHEKSCDKKVAGGCRICSRMSNLLHLHARQCKLENCKVPHCTTLREQFRKLQMSQMQMDDRRRQQMNLEYNRGTQKKSRGDEDDD